MAKQTGIVPLQGTIGNITFSKSGKKNRASEKLVVSPSRFASNPKFDRVRENAAEFSKAANGGKVLRLALRDMLKSFADKSTLTRVHGIMMQVVKGDAVHARGLRNVTDGALELLENFDFNAKKILKRTLDVDYASGIDRATGIMKVEIPAFIPREKLVPAPGATHFKILSAAAEIDFETGFSKVVAQNTEGLIWDENPTNPITLTPTVTPNSVHPLLLVLGIQYYQEVNGLLYALKGSDFNSLAVVKVSGE
jgi:hypothetical protein